MVSKSDSGKKRIYCCFFLPLTWFLYSICHLRPTTSPWRYHSSCLPCEHLFPGFLSASMDLVFFFFFWLFPLDLLLPKLTVMVFYWYFSSTSLSFTWNVILCLSHLFLWLSTTDNFPFYVKSNSYLRTLVYPWTELQAVIDCKTLGELWK